MGSTEYEAVNEFNGLSVARHPFVGRTRELARLVDWRHDDGSRMAVIRGEPGFGKSRLLHEFLALVPPNGIVRVNGSPDVDQRPFQAIVDALGMEPPQRATAPGLASDVRFRLHELMLDLVSVRASEGPVLLTVDDAQWLDPAALELLLAATDVVAGARVRLLVSTRPIGPDDARRKVVDQTDVEIAVEGLDEPALRDLLEFATGTSPSESDLAVARTARGNPLLALEAVQLARSRLGAESEHDLGHPLAGLRHRLADRDVRAATAAAVIGRSFTPAEVASVLGWTAAEASAASGALLRNDVVVAIDGATLSFRHDLLRETFIEAAPPAVLADLHRRRAEALAAATDGADTVAVARHLVASGGSAHTVSWLEAAGRALLETDPAGAAEFFRRGVDASPTPSVELVVALAQALTWSKRADEALVVLEAHELDGDPRVLLQRAQARSALGELGAAAELFEAAGEASDDPAHAARARGEGQLLRALAFDFDGAERNSREILSAPDVDPIAAVHAGCALGWVQQHRGQIDEAVATVRAAIDTAGHDPACLWRNPAMYLLDAHIAGDRLDDLGELTRAARRVAVDHGDIWQVPALSSMLAGAHFRTGEWDRSIAEIDAGRAWADQTGNRLALPWLLSLRAVIECRRGELDAADGALADADAVLSDETRSGSEAVGWARAWRLWTGGEPDAALELVDQLWTLMGMFGITNRTSTIAPMIARLSLEIGDRPRCARLVEELREIDDGSTSLVSLAPLRTLVSGLLDHDPSRLFDAAERFRALHLRPDHADTIVDLVEVCPPGRLSDFGTSIEDAGVHLRQLGATAALDRLSGRVPRDLLSAQEPSGDPLEMLTDAERRIAALIATGASNPEIGEQLYISRRTVESHLSHIFTKLGIAGRVELAVLASRV